MIITDFDKIAENRNRLLGKSVSIYKRNGERIILKIMGFEFEEEKKGYLHLEFRGCDDEGMKTKVNITDIDFIII